MPEPGWFAELEATSISIDGAVATVTLERTDAANARARPDLEPPRRTP
jgi:hypothetical protein